MGRQIWGHVSEASVGVVVGSGEAWYSYVQVSSDFLQVMSKGCIFIRLRELVPCIRHPKRVEKMRSQKEKRVSSDLGLLA